MKQLREHIRKELKTLMEKEMKYYSAPPEITNALTNGLKLKPLIRYVATLKAANTVPPSYTIFLHNGQSFALYIEKRSIIAKIGSKSYYLADMEENAEAIKSLNRLLTQPIPSSGEEDTGDQAGDTGGDTGGGTDTEMEPEEPADEPAEEPEA